MAPLVSRRLCLLAAFMVMLAALVHAVAHPGGFGHDDPLALHRFLVSYLVAVWLVSDPKLSNADRPSFDHAYMHMTFLPITASYEQFRTHRWKGLIRALGLCLLVLVTFVAAEVASF